MSLLYLFLTKCHHPVLPADRLWRISPSKAHWSSQQTVQVLNFSSDGEDFEDGEDGEDGDDGEDGEDGPLGGSFFPWHFPTEPPMES